MRFREISETNFGTSLTREPILDPSGKFIKASIATRRQWKDNKKEENWLRTAPSRLPKMSGKLGRVLESALKTGAEQLSELQQQRLRYPLEVPDVLKGEHVFVRNGNDGGMSIPLSGVLQFLFQIVCK